LKISPAQTEPVNGSSTYIPPLDGLRGLSIIIVFIAHVGFQQWVPGGFGVTIFFFISGYIITKLLIDEYARHGRLYLKLFYIRRLLRLYPPLLFMIGLLFSYLAISSTPINYHEIVACLLYYENYFFFYHGDQSSLICRILWSLSVEEHFYILFPILLMVLVKVPKWLIASLVLLTLAALCFRIFGELHYSSSPKDAERYTYALTHTRFDSIIFGCLAAAILYLPNTGIYRSLLTNKTAFAVAVVLLIACLIVRDVFFRNTFRYSLQGLSLFIIIPAVVSTPAYPVINRLLSGRVLVFIGKISYSVYLVHMVAISLVSYFVSGLHSFVYYISAAALTILFALCSYYIVEKPLMGLRKKFKSNDTFRWNQSKVLISK
jgi:peptidoglycan/LPS O-acetylase OafA/YrhL